MKSKNYSTRARHKCTPLLLISVRSVERLPVSADRTALPSTTVHRFVEISRPLSRHSPTRRLFIRLPLRSDRHNDAPFRFSHERHARDADECIGHRNVSFATPCATTAVNVDTSKLPVTHRPVLLVIVHQSTNRPRDHRHRTRYITVILILVMFSSAQARRHHRYVSKFSSTVHH